MEMIYPLKRKLIIIFLIFVLGATVVYGATLPKNMRQKLENIRTASSVYDRNGKLIGNLYYYRRIWTPISKISPLLQKAVVSIEDARFYKHNGIDLKGIARAAVHNLIPGGAMEGGSTITQQLAKISLLSSERTVSRKVQDITLALQIEQTYSKQEILELYLNSVYLAHGNVGVEAASRYFFNKSAADLNLSEAALIAGMIRSPENYSPLKNMATAKKRRDLVLKKMAEYKYITQAQAKAAMATGIKIVKQNNNATVGGYFLDYVKEQLIKQGFTEEQLRFGGYKIYTTLDLNAQKAAEQTMAAQLPKIASAKIQPQGALVSLDVKSGEILAMVGGRSYAGSQYNRAVKSYRQPGSAVKPFVYATALEKGYTAASIIEDKPLSIVLENGTEWSPENYDRTYRGPISLRVALRHSVNTVAVQLLQDIGPQTVAEQMERMGITSLVKKGTVNDINLAPLALGGLTKGVTPLELAAAYLPFPNLGVYVEPTAVRKVVDRNGKTVKKYTAKKRAVLSAETSYIMTMLMKDVVEQGTGQRAKLSQYPVAGKTGTSSDYTNAWFVGYTPQVVTAVWIGNDRQDMPMKYKERTIGSATAAQLWGAYMKSAMAGRQVVDFTQPPGIVWADVDPKTGLVVPGIFNRDTYQEVFNAKNIPASNSYKIWNWFFPEKQAPEDESGKKPGAPDPSTPDVEQF